MAYNPVTMVNTTMRRIVSMVLLLFILGGGCRIGRLVVGGDMLNGNRSTLCLLFWISPGGNFAGQTWCLVCIAARVCWRYRCRVTDLGLIEFIHECIILFDIKIRVKASRL